MNDDEIRELGRDWCVEEQADKPAPSQGERCECGGAIAENLGNELRCRECGMLFPSEPLDQVFDDLAEARQRITALTGERDQLAEWKRQQLIVSADFQAIGQELGVGLGESVYDKILPGIQKLKAERDTLRSALEKYMTTD